MNCNLFPCRIPRFGGNNSLNWDGLNSDQERADQTLSTCKVVTTSAQQGKTTKDKEKETHQEHWSRPEWRKLRLAGEVTGHNL
jgi:hypothetical protein